MSPHNTARDWSRLLYYLSQNVVSFVGVVLTTSSAITLMGFWIYDFMLPGPSHSYVGILLFLILSGVFVLGLLLIPMRILLRRRNFMDTASVMAPEFSAYQNSPHARVECVQCHIGLGAGWFVRSKLSKVYAVTFKTYSTPIPTPVKYLRPARETCEPCHWPQRFSGDKFIVKTNYKEDEKNTPMTTAC
jgi:hypothetical protein